VRLAGRRALVTGAASGLGAALTRALVDAGAAVTLVDIRGDLAEVVAARMGAGAAVLTADLAEADQVHGLIERAEAEGGPVDVLVNNAGVEQVGLFAGTDERDLVRLFQLNLTTPAQLCRQAIPRMLARGGGHIVNVSSIAAAGPVPGIVAYAATKAGLSSLTDGLRSDHRGQPLGVTLVELGPMRTDMIDRAYAYRPTAAAFRRFYRLGVLTEIDPRMVARAAVAAVEGDRPVVRLPRRVRPLLVFRALPARLAGLALTGVPPRID
jgi:short-subunit dehydrogenase